jgi:hypothetical protein
MQRHGHREPPFALRLEHVLEQADQLPYVAPAGEREVALVAEPLGQIQHALRHAHIARKLAQTLGRVRHVAMAVEVLDLRAQALKHDVGSPDGLDLGLNADDG